MYIVYYIQLDAEFQRIADKLQSEQCYEIEENNRMRKTRLSTPCFNKSS